MKEFIILAILKTAERCVNNFTYYIKTNTLNCKRKIYPFCLIYILEETSPRVVLFPFTFRRMVATCYKMYFCHMQLITRFLVCRLSNGLTVVNTDAVLLGLTILW